MTDKEFIKRLTSRKSDIVQTFLDILAETHSQYCLIGGLAVNAYVEPVVSLDMDIVVAAENIDMICEAAKKRGFKIERFEHSIKLTDTDADLRIQIQTDPRYQKFVSVGQENKVLGYSMRVARLEDVLQGKILAYSDERRRKSKRQKDLADIYRILEKYPHLKTLLPAELAAELEL